MWRTSPSTRSNEQQYRGKVGGARKGEEWQEPQSLGRGMPRAADRSEALRGVGRTEDNGDSSGGPECDASLRGVSHDVSGDGGVVAPHEKRHAGRNNAGHVSPSSASRLGERSESESAQRHRGAVSPAGRKADDSRYQYPKSQKQPSVRQPWFPARSTTTEDHIPLENRESFRNRAEGIRELERRSRGSGRGSGHSYSAHISMHE